VDDGGLEVHHVLPEPEENLWSRLAADAAVEHFEAGGSEVRHIPAFGYGVADEDDARRFRAGSRQLQVLVAVAQELSPVGLAAGGLRLSGRDLRI